MTVGLHSPLPPAPTGVADYSSALLQELRRHGRVEISPDRCNIRLYHIGNNILHTSTYRRAISEPGVVVLHDALLQHFYLGSLSQKSYEQEFFLNYGEWNRDEARTLWRDRALSAQDARYFSRPMLKRIAAGAKSVVVHNPAAAQAVREHHAAATIVEIPHFYEPRAFSPQAVTSFREKIGLPANGFVFAIFGFLRESKRLLATLQAFTKLRTLNPHVHLLIAGQFVSQDLRRAVSPLLSQPGVHRIGHLPEEEFRIAADSVEGCINLRYPAAGETSGIALRLMGAGKPVIVTEGEEWSRFPEGTLFPILSGPSEAAALFHAMAFLSDNPALARQMGLKAADHVQRYHSISASGNAYWNLLCRTFDFPSC